MSASDLVPAPSTQGNRGISIDMGRSRSARKKAQERKKAAQEGQGEGEEAHSQDAVQSVDTETAPHNGGPVPPATNGSMTPNLEMPENEKTEALSSETEYATATNGSMTPKSEKTEAQPNGGCLTPTSIASSPSYKRASIVHWADLAESTGDIAEKEADDISSTGISESVDPVDASGYRTPNGNTRSDGVTSKPETNGSVRADGGLKERRKAGFQRARATDYPPLSNAAGREAAARERDRMNAYRAGGIRFAPWNIPYRRRLQTMAVLVHSLSIAVTFSFFFFLCANPLLWPLLIPYLLHMLLSKSAVDGRLRARSERFRRHSVWKFFSGYFPAQLHKTHDLPPTRKYIFGYHPHGIISHGAFAAFCTEALGFSEKFPGITNSLLTLDSNFRIPLYRDYILAMGIQSVSKESIQAILTRGGPNGEGMGRAVTIVVGGARESLAAQPGTMHLVLAQRKGFVKMAMRTGADLVPVLAFGENDLYDQVSPQQHPLLHSAQMWVLRTLKFTLPFLHGRGIFNYDVGLMPYRRPLNVVVGRPIPVRQAREAEGIESREVERLHAEYVGELERMWETYKDVFATERKEEMKIIS